MAKSYLWIKFLNFKRARSHLHIFLLSLFLTFGLLALTPPPCLAQSSPKEKIDALYEQYEHLKKEGRYNDALRYATELVPAGEKAFGKDHPDVATFLNNLA